MKQFNLSEWLVNPNRKVVTRDGREVRILCIDCGVRESQPILVEITCSRNTKVLEYYNIDGTTQDKNLNLFFADEEEGLSEFEKALLAAFYCVAGKAVTTIGTASFQEDVDEWSKPLLDIARKELEATDWKDSMRKYKEAYEQGKQDTLKDLDSLIEDKVAEKFAELFSKLPMQPYLYQPYPNQPNPFQPTTVLYGCPSTQSDVVYDTKTLQDNE